jgi:hypothetical protein
MLKIPKTRVGILLPAALWLCCSIAVAVQLTREEGERLQKKIDEIAENGSSQPVQTKKIPISENEVNSYLIFNLRDKIPQGLTSPSVNILGNGRLAGRVLVDIDEFKRHRRVGGFFDPLVYVSGKVPVAAQGVLRTREGKGQFHLRSAEIYGIPLPKPLLQELVTFFSRTRKNPKGFDMDKPFELPANIREVVIDKGEAVVVQ